MRTLILFIFIFFCTNSAYASCDSTRCNVLNFSGTFDQQIASAIAAAKLTSHKTVYIPNGTHEITKTVFISNPNDVSEKNVELRIYGQSDTGTVIKYIAQAQNFSGTFALPPAFNVDKLGGFDFLSLEIKNMTIDMTSTRSHSLFLNAGSAGSAHGIRVGNGYNSGRVLFENIRINHPSGYGIGIQTIGSDLNADNLVFRNIYISHSGQDGIDIKAPDQRLNKNYRFFNITVNDIGEFDDRAAAGIDVRLEDFYIRGYSFRSDPLVPNPLNSVGTNTVGIQVRPDSNDGTVFMARIEEGLRGITFLGENSEILVKSTLIINSRRDGALIRNASDITFRYGCFYGYGNLAIVEEGDNSNIDQRFATLNIPQCPEIEGSSYPVNFARAN